MHNPDLTIKFMFFNRSYFPYDKQNGTHSRKSNEKENEFEFNFLIIVYI